MIMADDEVVLVLIEENGPDNPEDGEVYTEVVNDFREDISNVNAIVVSKEASAFETADDSGIAVVVDSIGMIIR